jgi:hypothetical protein
MYDPYLCCAVSIHLISPKYNKSRTKEDCSHLGEVVNCLWSSLAVTNLTQKVPDNLIISSLTYHWVKMQMDIEHGIGVRDDNKTSVVMIGEK